MSPSLPIDVVLPELIATLRRSSNVVVRAPTGAGKTTRVPPAILDAGFAGSIVMLEPRRLAARAAARRMSFERGAKLGAEIGYQVRFDRCAGPQTRILVVTPGILLRMLHDDPYLESIGTIIFDEFHERSVENDLALGLAKLIQQTVRPELRLVVMSATLAVNPVSAYLDNCPIVASEGRLHHVEIAYEPCPLHEPLPIGTARAVNRLIHRTTGDLLAFLPGLNEIRRTAQELEALAQSLDLAVLPLHGDLPPEQQDLALLAQARRRVVLATNVAETSVTVDGITGVIDTGLARIMQFDPAVGLDRLELMPISRASADQRAGRAGRTQPGVCIRLWSEVAQRSRPEQTEPEIRRVDLAGAVLQLLALGETDVRRFPWLEPPPEAAIQQALSLLIELSALRDLALTPIGQQLARLPVHPRIGRLLVEGQALGVVSRVALAGALLSERDPFSRSVSAVSPSTQRPNTNSDILDRIEALEAFEHSGQTDFPIGTLHRGGARFVLHARDQLIRILRQETRDSLSSTENSDEAILRAIFAAFPDRLVRRRDPGSDRGVMVGGKGVRLAPSSGVRQGALFVAVDVDAGGADVLVRQASLVERDWLPANRIETGVEVRFDELTERVEARKITRFDDLILEDQPAKLPPDEETCRVLIFAATTRLEKVLPTSDSPEGQYLTRIRCLRDWAPELSLPAFDEADLREMLTWLAPGCRSLEDLRKADWRQAIRGKLSYEQVQAIEREAPERIEVPSGSQIALSYELGRPPVLAVRIQEMFGCADTPRVANGRVKVLLHLLAPNYRPQQLTDDLASFWANTYPRVRGELRSRYPKHSWPEDPLSAEAVRGPKRRKPAE
jgi:ATP-dependent helicase HrpB